MILVLFGLITVASSTELTCEFKTEKWTLYKYLNLAHKTCVIENEAIELGSTIKLYVNESAEGLKVQNNKEVKHIPENLADAMPKLKMIDFENCAIRSIGKQLKGLRELVALRFTSNQIETIESDAFADNLKLEWISFWNNKLKLVSDQIFRPLKNLRTLLFSINKIDFVDPGSFDGLINLEYLGLESNKITLIDAKTFKSLNKLKELALSRNQIKDIDPRSFDGLQSLDSVDLNHNVCIRQKYNSSEFTSMRNAFTNCTSSKKVQEQILTKQTELKKQLSTLNTNLNSNLKSEIVNLKSEITNLKAQMTTVIKNELKTFMDNMMQTLNTEILNLNVKNQELEAAFKEELNTERKRSITCTQNNFELKKQIETVNSTLDDLVEKSKGLKESYDACMSLLD